MNPSPGFRDLLVAASLKLVEVKGVDNPQNRVSAIYWSRPH